MNRRELLRLLAAALAAPGLARASERSLVGACHLDLGADPVRPRAVADLLDDIARLTSIPTRPEVRTRTLRDPELARDPLLVLAGDEGFDVPTGSELDALRRHVGQGGFLLIDDSSALEESPFHASVQQMLAAAFPDAPLRPIGTDHAVFRSFFLVDRVVGRYVIRPYLEGVRIGGATGVVVSRNDLCGAWTRSPGGGWAWEVVPGGESQRTHAIELGVNLVVYALTLDYKLDAIHVEALLRRMREEGRIP